MTIHFAKRGQAPIGGCVPADSDRSYARWGAVNAKGTQVDCTECLAFRPVIEDDKFIAMMQRNLRTLEERAVENPAILAQVLLLAQRLNEIPNVVIAKSATRYSVNPLSAPSAAEIGKLLGMSKQSASERRKVGERVLFERSMGQETITRAERAARTRAAAHADATLASWFERVAAAEDNR